MSDEEFDKLVENIEEYGVVGKIFLYEKDGEVHIVSGKKKLLAAAEVDREVEVDFAKVDDMGKEIDSDLCRVGHYDGQ